MRHTFPRDTRFVPPVAVAAEGVYIEDSTGTRYIDASGGAGVSCLGHGHPAVIAAIQAQAARLAYAHTAFFTSEPAEALADHLARHAPPGLDRVYFVCDGSEGIEASLSWPGNIFSRSAKSGAAASSRAARAITATRWARSRSAATCGGVSRFARC